MIATSPQIDAAPTPAATIQPDALRLLTLAAMILGIRFKEPKGQEALESPIMGQAGEVSSRETE